MASATASTSASAINDELPELPLPAGAVGVTEWRDDFGTIPDGFSEELAADRFDNVDALLEELIAAIRSTAVDQDLEVSARYREGSEADGVTIAEVRSIGFGDDSVLGSEQLLRLERGDAGWYVAAVEARFFCRRAADGALCV